MTAFRKEPSGTTITMRLSVAAKRRLEQAAAVQGRSVSALVLEAADARAADILLDRTVFKLSDEAMDAFLEMLDNPPPPNEKLRAAFAKKPIWQ